ncbi:hypothetical protein BX616_004142, partial [Lobosporangium transversale]
PAIPRADPDPAVQVIATVAPSSLSPSSTSSVDNNYSNASTSSKVTPDCIITEDLEHIQQSEQHLFSKRLFCFPLSTRSTSSCRVYRRASQKSESRSNCNNNRSNRSSSKEQKSKTTPSGSKASSFIRMINLSRNKSLPVSTNSDNGASPRNENQRGRRHQRFYSNTFSFPVTLHLNRTLSGKSDRGNINSSTLDNNDTSAESHSSSISSAAATAPWTSIAPLSAVISAIHRGDFLVLSDSRLDALIRALTGKNSTVLETINIKGTTISGSDARLLARLVKSSDAANIKNLKLDQNLISQDGFKYLCESFKYNKTITTLSFSRAGMNDKIIKYIAKAVSKSGTIKELDLSNNRLTAQGIEVLCEALIYNRSLTRLCLQSNNIKKAGAPHLANLLTKNRVLRHLNVGSNGIGSEGCTLIANAVRFNRALTSLSLDMNEMGSQGATALATALASNRNLMYLYIPHNNIGDRGLAMICESLKRNQVLIGLDLELNHIGHGQSIEGMKALAEALKVNKALREINLSFNSFPTPAIEALMEGLAANSTLESILFTNCSIPTGGALAIAKILPTAKGLQNLGLTANTEISVEGYWALANSLNQNRSMKGLQLDFNSEGRHALYNIIQHSLTRNFIWQRAIYSAACRILVFSRIVLLGRPVNQRNLLSLSHQLQKRNNNKNGGNGSGSRPWNLLWKVGQLGIAPSSAPSTSTHTSEAQSNSTDGEEVVDSGNVMDDYGGMIQNLTQDNLAFRQASNSSSSSGAASYSQRPAGTHLGVTQQRQGQEQQEQSIMPSPSSLRPPFPSSPSTTAASARMMFSNYDYNVHKMMANLCHMPYEVLETICVFLDPGCNMSVEQIRTTLQTGGDRSTLRAYYTRPKMMEKIFQSRYIPTIGMRYSIKNNDERL